MNSVDILTRSSNNYTPLQKVDVSNKTNKKRTIIDSEIITEIV